METTNERELRDMRYELNTYIDFIEYLENEIGFLEIKELRDKFNQQSSVRLHDTGV